MAANERQLLVSAERCIGCRACATVCPAGLITLSDTDRRRTVWFAAVCREECTRCVEACPTEAINLPTVTGAVRGEGTRLDFELRACAGCGAPVATVEMLAWLRAVIPPEVQTDAEGTQWLELCPQCRQEVEAQRVAREVIMARWP
ncbi:MAG: 4Fe-4S dicluster domain-containing protein [Anaerolineae bacterium]|jgi:Fe-S-cluster-containing hydrogenase component 2|nr:4Fe-4S dicluster domain-containing protein [Anaerolineae bacterium]